MNDGADPLVSFVLPARNEAPFLGELLDSIQSQQTAHPYETVVVDGDSDDETVDIARAYGARVIEGAGKGRGHGRHLGARHARGTWLAFVDADTLLHTEYLDTMVSFLREHGLTGGASRCRVDGGWRTRPFEFLFNYILPRLVPPVFPGFNVFVRRAAYFDVGGFTTGPNEDVSFSRRLGREYPTGVCPAVLVETSGRRIERQGLVRTVAYYTRKEWRRQRAARTSDQQ